MPKVDEEERNLLELTRKHIKKEKEIIAHLKDPKIKPINENRINDLISKNCRLEDEILERCAEFYGSFQLQDHSVREQLIKIRDKTTATQELLSLSFGVNLATGKERPHEEAIGRIKKFKEEREKKDLNRRDETLAAMLDYLMDQAGYSGDFFERKKDFGTIFIEKASAPNMDTFLNYLKTFYLLNMHEAVVGFARILLEIACQWIYDRLPEKDKINIRNMHRKKPPVVRMIERACQKRLESLGKNEKEIDDFPVKAGTKYGEASAMLHGELPNPSTQEESLKFVKEVFFIIESLYSEQKRV